ncbi:hypothetical protein H1R20_g6101, partial [Candolleomyces eurysporus]
MTATPLASSPAAEDAVHEEEENVIVTTELRAELDSLPDADTKELVERLSVEAGPSRLVLLHHGLTCSGHNTSEAGEEEKEVQGEEVQVETRQVQSALCFPAALNAAYVAFDLHAQKLKESPSGGGGRR